MSTNFTNELIAKPGKKVKLSKWDAEDTLGWDKDHKMKESLDKAIGRLDKLQYLLYAEHKRTLLIVLQGLDAAGKDGTIRHVMSGVNPQGCQVTSFKKPSAEEMAHEYLWRIHKAVPEYGNIGIFNRSVYEDVLVVRVHNLVPKRIWSKRYRSINEFEKLLWHENNTRILKFFLYISPEEQLERFKERLDDPARNWKISEDDYREREFWDDYIRAYEAVFRQTSTDYAPWYVIPANHKWFPNFDIAQIVAATFQEMNIQTPKPQVDLELIRRQYHQAEEQEAEPQTPSNNQSRSTKPKK